MKKTFIDEKEKIVQYCDLSSGEELTLRLLGNLLIQSSEGLEAADVRELGFILKSFLDQKLFLDHLFWGRAVPESLCSKIEIKKKIHLFKITKKVENT